MNLSIEEKLTLMKEQHNFTMIEKTNEFAMTYAKLSLNACFFLNGAAATALLSTKLYWAAAMCGFGAFFAAFALGIAYWYTLALLESWRCSPDPENSDAPYIPVWLPCKGTKLITYTQLEQYRLVPIVCFIISLVLFLTGLGLAVKNV